MCIRAGLVWLGILVLASLNGALRDLIVAPRIGDTIARAISTVILCGLVLLVAWVSIRWLGPRGPKQALGVGLFWVALALTFELAAGRLSGKPWSVALADYDVLTRAHLDTGADRHLPGPALGLAGARLWNGEP